MATTDQPQQLAPKWAHPSQIPFVRAGSDAPAVADAERELTGAEFATEVARVAGGLTGLGVGRGDVVATMLPNRSELVVVLFAAWRLGAAVTPVNPALTANEAAYQVSDAAAKVAVVDRGTAARLDGVDARLLSLDELAQLEGEDPAAEPSFDDTALLIYTSGTTGRPKGVVIDHANVKAMVEMMVRHFRLTEDDRSLVVMPLFHANGLVASVLSSLTAGGSTVILEKFSKSAFWDQVERYRPTYFSLVPAMYMMFNSMPEDVQPETSFLRFCVCGAAPVPAQTLTDFQERYGTPIVEGYGLSETTVASNIVPLDGPFKPGSVGPALEGCEVRIVDEEGKLVPQGEPGEVTIKGPQVMRGYLGKPEDTEKTLRDGWLHSGDVGYLDEDGYLFLVDRKKDMIIRGGENIYPTEIEHQLVEHEAIAEAAVVGRKHDMLGEEPVAFVSLADGKDADEEAILEFANERLAPYKVPKEVRLVDELPRNAVGKLDKPTMRQMLEGDGDAGGGGS
jgi:acyl-CoA synthetase (AMP-forming)/AMP-acid ligase II